MKRPLLRRLASLLGIALLCAASSVDRLLAQGDYRSEDYIVEAAPCWTTVMEFYDHQAFPYYSVDGYYFDANPFRITRWMDGNTSMIMRSTKGYSLIDVTGRYRWTDARIRVNCFERRTLGGLIRTPYAVVVHEFGAVERISTACRTDDPGDPIGGGDYLMGVESEVYDPYDPYQVITTADCSGGGGGDGGNSGDGLKCWHEFMVIEASYDGGMTWQEFWAGWGLVCEPRET